MPKPSDSGEDTMPEPFKAVAFTIASGDEGNSALPRHPTEYTDFKGRFLIFYGATDYETDHKDNFWYEVVPDPDDTPPFDARIKWGRGNRYTRIRVRDTMIGVPPWVQVSHRSVYHRENAELDMIELPAYPEGWTGIVITEVLGHISNGDDDHGYRIDTGSCRSSEPRVRIDHGFDSNRKNDLVVRVTQLRWKDTLNIVARCPRFILPVVDGDGVRLRLPEADTDPDSYLIPQLTTYWPHETYRNSGSGADDDMAYEYRTSDDISYEFGEPYLEGRYTNRGYITLTLYELDLWPGQ